MVWERKLSDGERQMLRGIRFAEGGTGFQLNVERSGQWVFRDVYSIEGLCLTLDHAELDWDEWDPEMYGSFPVAHPTIAEADSAEPWVLVPEEA